MTKWLDDPMTKFRRSRALWLREEPIRPIVITVRMGFVFAAMLAAPLSAQWLNTPTPGVPRTADGKPDLSAPAPKAADGHPDLSGVWMPNTRSLQDLAADMKPGEVAARYGVHPMYVSKLVHGKARRPVAVALGGCHVETAEG